MICAETVVKPMILLCFCTSASPKPVAYNFGCSLSCPVLGPGEASETLTNQCFFAYFENEGCARSSHQMDPEEQKMQKIQGKCLFFENALGAL